MEERMVRKAQKGNKKAFDHIIREISQDAYRIAYYYLHHQTDSQDAVASAIEKTYSKLKQLEDCSKFKSWFLTIVANEARMIYRKKDRHKVIPIDSLDYLAYAESDREEIMDLRIAMRKLEPRDRSILMMKYYEGYTFREIGTMLELPESTVKTRTYSALKELRKILNRKESAHGQL